MDFKTVNENLKGLQSEVGQLDADRNKWKKSAEDWRDSATPENSPNMIVMRDQDGKFKTTQVLEKLEDGSYASMHGEIGQTMTFNVADVSEIKLPKLDSGKKWKLIKEEVFEEEI